MPAKKSTKAKSRVLAKSKKGGFKFKWWMGLILVVVVGGVGFVVFRQSYAYRDCGTTPTGAICGGGPVQFTITNVQRYNNNQGLSMDGHFPNNFNPQVYLHRGGFDQDDAIYKLISRENTECGRISRENPFGAKRGLTTDFQSPNELRYGIYYAWWTPVGC